MERSGDPAALVAPEVPPEPVRRAVLVRPERPALVLGSAQEAGDADRATCAALGWSVVRRRSGGGAVPVAPEAQVWLDVFLPAGDRRFEQDVSRAGWWIGELWSRALRLAGVGGELAVHRGPLVGGAWSRLACFSGVGPGEVLWEGRKLVGCSQRRSRAGCWLHTMALATGQEHAGLAQLLALSGPERGALSRELSARSASLPVPARPVEEALDGLLGEA